MLVVADTPKNKTRKRIILINTNFMQLRGEFTKWETRMLENMGYMAHYKENSWGPPEAFGNASWWISEPPEGRRRFIELTKKILTFGDTFHSSHHNTDYTTVFKNVNCSLSYPMDSDIKIIKKYLGNLNH